MRKLLPLLALLPLQAVHAWGVYGHETVGAIADSLLNPAASAKVGELLNGESLEAVSIWADCLKYPDMKACARQLPDHAAEWLPVIAQTNGRHAQFHYTDVDIASAAYSGSDNDVVHVLQQAIGVLQGDTNAPNPWHFSPAQALWMLDHLVGDVHQPLHVGVLPVDGSAKASLGGNRFYPEPDHCLHSDWDDRYVEEAMTTAGHAGNPWGYALALTEHHWPRPADAADLQSRPAQWATDTMAVARDVAFKGVVLGAQASGDCGYHHPEQGWAVTLPADYDQRAQQAVDQQIWKAGARLAELLNDLWPDQGGK